MKKTILSTVVRTTICLIGARLGAEAAGWMYDVLVRRK